jgi:hypothetical protein
MQPSGGFGEASIGQGQAAGSRGLQQLEDAMDAANDHDGTTDKPGGNNDYRVTSPYPHIIDQSQKNAKKVKCKSAFGHFRLYTCKHYGKAVDPYEIPYGGLDQALFGGFATYLSTEARCYMNPMNGLISLNSAVGYISSVKMYFLNKYRDKAEPPVFSSTQWKRILAAITSEAVERCKKTGAHLVTPRETATDDDIVCLATLCAWDGTPTTAEFLHFNNTMAQLAGRGECTKVLGGCSCLASDRPFFSIHRV